MTAPADGQSGRDDYCPRMGETCTGVCPDCNAEVRALIAPAPVRGVGTGQGEELREAIARTIAVTSFVMVPDPEGGSYGTSASPEEVAHALLAGPLADLVAERDTLREFALSRQRQFNDWCVDRALDGTEQQGRDR